MFEFCLYNSVIDDFSAEISPESCGDAMCQLCPVEECITECEWNQFYNENTDPASCGECLPECAAGCVREENCNPCVDEHCNECEDREVCTQCILHASGNPCSCDVGYGYNQEDNTCEQCHEDCETCSGKGQYS